MNNANKVLVTSTAILLLAIAPPVGAQIAGGGEACKMEKISPQPNPDFLTAFNAAEKRAKAWKPDVVIARLTHTSLGPIDPEGRSTNWHMVWYSPGTNANDMITIANGSITCYAMPGPSGRLGDIKPEFYRDVRKLLAEANAHGGAALMAEGYAPRVELSAGAKGKVLWYVNYEHPTKRGSLQVTFDGNTGKFENAIK